MCMKYREAGRPMHPPMHSATPPVFCIFVAWLCVHASSFTSVAASPTTTLSTSDIQVVETRTEENFDPMAIKRYGSKAQCTKECILYYHKKGAVCLKSLRSAKKEYICCVKITPKYYGKECREALRNATEDACSSDPCLHGGSCMIQHTTLAQTSTSTDGYQCKCGPSFTGQRCETAIELANQCIQDPDGSGNCKYGTCYNLTNKKTLHDIVAKEIKTFVNTAPQVEDADIIGLKTREDLEKEFTIMVREMLLETSVHKRPKEDKESVCYCDLGYMGFKCDLECPKRRWGPYCLGTCARKCITCSPADGICLECYRGHYFSLDKRRCLEKACDNTLCIHGTCQQVGIDTFCTCNDYYSGLWCDLSCSDLGWPSHSENCDHLCGRCITQPCNMFTGECPVAQNGSRCMDGFRNSNCSELDIEGEELLSAEVQMDLKYVQNHLINLYNSPSFDFFLDVRVLNLNEELVENQMLHKEVDAHFMETFQEALYRRMSVVCMRCTISRKKRKNQLAKRIRRQSQSGQQDVPRLQFVISVSVPASKFGSASRAERYVKKKIKKTSDRFESNVVPGLKIDKDSIKTRKVTLETTGTQTTDTKWMNSRYLLGGVIIAGGLLIFASLLLFVRKYSKQNQVMPRNRRSKFIPR